MLTRAVPLALFALALLPAPASAGAILITRGETIKDFAISYVTHGKLNEKKNNAILMTSSIGGNHHRIDFLIGPGKALDTDKYFIIATDAIGNGLSTSPSNSKSQPGTKFPRFTIRDMVQSQYRLVKEKFGISRLLAAYDRHDVGTTPGFDGDAIKALQSVKARAILMNAPRRSLQSHYRGSR